MTKLETNGKCPCCHKKGTTKHEIVFYTCDEHTEKDVYEQQLLRGTKRIVEVDKTQ